MACRMAEPYGTPAWQNRETDHLASQLGRRAAQPCRYVGWTSRAGEPEGYPTRLTAWDRQRRAPPVTADAGSDRRLSRRTACAAHTAPPRGTNAAEPSRTSIWRQQMADTHGRTAAENRTISMVSMWQMNGCDASFASQTGKEGS